MSDLYLRDLTGILKDEMIADIQKHKPEWFNGEGVCTSSNDDGKDVIVGEIFNHDKYELVN